MMIEAAVRQTHSTSVDDYRAKLIARITGLHAFYEFTRPYGRMPGLAELVDQTLHPYSAKVFKSSRPDLISNLSPHWRLRCTWCCMSLPRSTQLSPRARQDRMESPARSGRPSQARHRMDRARRARGAASAASRFWFTAHQESTRRIRRSAAGLQSHWSRLLHADRSGSPRRANRGESRIIMLSRHAALTFDDIMSMPKSVTAAPIADHASEMR
jgi:hypothetical protein